MSHRELQSLTGRHVIKMVSRSVSPIPHDELVLFPPDSITDSSILVLPQPPNAVDHRLICPVKTRELRAGGEGDDSRKADCRQLLPGQR